MHLGSIATTILAISTTGSSLPTRSDWKEEIISWDQDRASTAQIPLTGNIIADGAEALDPVARAASSIRTTCDSVSRNPSNSPPTKAVLVYDGTTGICDIRTLEELKAMGYTFSPNWYREYQALRKSQGSKGSVGDDLANVKGIISKRARGLDKGSKIGLVALAGVVVCVLAGGGVMFYLYDWW